MRRSLFKRCALGVVISFCAAALSIEPAWAGSVDQQEQRVKDVVAEIERMHRKVDEYNEEYLAALNDKAAVEADIVLMQQHIAEQQAARGLLRGQLASVAVEQFMGGGGSGALGPLFENPEMIDDGLQREHLATVAVNAGAASTDDYETLLSELAESESELEQQQQHAVDLAERAEASKGKAEQAATDLEARLVKEKAELGNLIEEEQARQEAAAIAAYEADLEQKQAAAAAKASANSNSSTSSGSSGNSGNSGSSNSGSGSSSNSGSSGSTSNSGSSGSSGDDGSSSNDSGSGGGGDSGASNPPPVSSRASVAVNAAQGQLGVKYQFAQSSPGVAFDCSGLTSYAWGQAGVSIPHQSAAQYASTPHVSQDQAQPGDLIFYYSPISHVGLYIGGGSMIHAPQTGTTVSYSVVRWEKVVGVSRPG